eukprot:135237-Hanusia_phi.AAC.1
MEMMFVYLQPISVIGEKIGGCVSLTHLDLSNNDIGTGVEEREARRGGEGVVRRRGEERRGSSEEGGEEGRREEGGVEGRREEARRKRRQIVNFCQQDRQELLSSFRGYER